MADKITDISVQHPVIQSRVWKLGPGGRSAERDDWVAVEAPLEVRIGGAASTVMMRTPGNDDELVRGFLFSEGIVTSNAEIVSIGNVEPSSEQAGGGSVAVELAPGAGARPLERSFYSNASCGVCGKTSIASLEVRGAEADTPLRVSRAVLGMLPDRLRAEQSTFAKTGGVHASGLFTAAGDLVCLREDVGRHNALDKLIGWAMKEGRLPLADYILLVSGRVSYEIVQKAVAASIPFIAAVGAPSSLAVDLAERFKLTLAGFLRADSMNIYTHVERITD